MAEKDKSATDERDLRIEALEETVAGLRKLIESGSVNSVAVKEKETREAWYQEQVRHYSRGNVVLTQEIADRRYPAGSRKFRCHLPDKNGHPEIVIRADNEIDAAGRYLDVCGVTAAEKRVTVTAAETPVPVPAAKPTPPGAERKPSPLMK